mgnify:CR=1 FL=1
MFERDCGGWDFGDALPAFDESVDVGIEEVGVPFFFFEFVAVLEVFECVVVVFLCFVESSDVVCGDDTEAFVDGLIFYEDGEFVDDFLCVDCLWGEAGFVDGESDGFGCGEVEGGDVCFEGAEFFECLFVVTDIGVGVEFASHGVEVSGHVVEGAFELDDGFFVEPSCLEGFCETHAGLSGLWVERDCFVSGFDCFGVSS